MNEEDVKLRLDGDSEEESEIMMEEQAQEIRAVFSRMLSSYAQKPEAVTTEDWLKEELRRELPDLSEEEAQGFADETIKGIVIYEDNLEKVNKACVEGKTKEEWLTDTISQAAVNVEINQFGNYLAEIDATLAEANAAMYETVMTTSQEAVSMNPNLDGFIAEQHHVNTFNADAALKNSDYRAVRYDRPDGGTFGKNSVDLAIVKKGNNQSIQRYQAKYYKTAKASIRAVSPDRYGNQRGLVPKGHADPESVKANLPAGSKKTITDHIGEDTVDAKSTPFSKEKAEALRDRIQRTGRLSGKLTWNHYEVKELAYNVSKQAAFAGVGAAAITSGMVIVTKAVKGEKIKGEEVIETAIATGADAGVKAATAGALKVAVERNLIKFIPKREMALVTKKAIELGVSRNLARAFPYTMMACVAIENIKVMSKCASGELTVTETLDCMGRSTVSLVGGLVGTGFGAEAAVTLLGLAAGGPLAIAAGLVGGIVAGIVGSKAGEAIYAGAKAVGKAAVTVVKTVGKAVIGGVKAVARGAKAIASAGWNAAKAIGRGICSLFS